MAWWFKRRDAEALGSLLESLSDAERLEALARMGDRAFVRGLYDASDAELRGRMSRFAASKSTALVEAPSETGELIGYASTWLDRGGPDAHGHVIRPGAYTKFVEEVNSGAIVVPMVAGADSDQGGHSDSPFAVVGWIVEARQDDRGLWIRAALSSDADAQTIRAKITSRALRGLSISYRSGTSRPIRLADGRDAQELDQIDVYHVAITPHPANRSAQIMAAKSGPGGMSEYARVVGGAAVAAPAIAARPGPELDAAGHQLMADVLGRVEADSALASLEAWANSPEVQRAMVRDPQLDLVERDRGRRARENDYTASLSAWKSQQATTAGCGRCQWCARGVPSSCVYAAR
jgi:HK97 family phage prohead protease